LDPLFQPNTNFRLKPVLPNIAVTHLPGMVNTGYHRPPRLLQYQMKNLKWKMENETRTK